MARATSPARLAALLDKVWPDHAVVKDGSEHMVLCPFCDSAKEKLAVNPQKGVFQCWVCGERGPVFKLLKHLFDLQLISQTDIDAVRTNSELVDLSSYIKAYKGKPKNENFLWSETIPCVFPSETYSISGFKAHNNFEEKQLIATKKYLRRRGMDESDIENLRLHFCTSMTSPYYAHIFFPALGERGKQLVFWTTRSILPNANPKSLHSSRRYSRFSAKQILMNQHLIVGPKVALCEGPFDAFSIIKATGIPAVPLLGKQLHDYHREVLLDKGVKEVYICLDPDARQQQTKLLSYFPSGGVKVYSVELDEGDPNSISGEKLKAAFDNAAFGEINPFNFLNS